MLILIIVGIVIIVFIFYKLIKQIKHISAKNQLDVSQQYYCNEGNFMISGYKDEFSICKNENIEFLVRNGQIIATRDLRINNEFVYYEGEKTNV